MDDKNQNPEDPQSPESQVPSVNPPAAPAKSSRKIIQPSEGLVNEMAANPDSYYDRSSTTDLSASSNTKAPDSAPDPTQTAPIAPNPSTIYPEATHGLLDTPVSDTQNKGSQSVKPIKDTLTNIIIICVIALGLFIAVPAVLSIIGWARIISYGDINALGKVGAPIYTFDAIYLLVGIGLILRKELARIAYIIIGAILLLIGLYGTINYFRLSHGVSGLATFYADAAASAQSEVTSDTASIKNYQSNSSLSVAQKQQTISELESDLNKGQKQLVQDKQLQNQNSGINSLIRLIPTYLFAIIPLIFLTRRKVKEVFS